MSAADNLSGEQFRPMYHGTIETLKPGDLITPRQRGGYAWATVHMPAAIEHTKDRAIHGLGATPDAWPVHHGNVYEVEPADPNDESLTGNTMAATRGSVASEVGFKVKRQVASVLGEDSQRRDAKKYFPDFDPSKEAYVKDGRDRMRNK